MFRRYLILPPSHVAIVFLSGASVCFLIQALYKKYCDRKKGRGGLGSPHPAVNNAVYSNCIYLDYNATTPIWPEVAEAMSVCSQISFGNPSSPHVFGRMSKDKLDTARKCVANLINAPDPSSIVFIASGTEGDNRAIDIAIDFFVTETSILSADVKPHIIASAIEHPAISLYLTKLQKKNLIEVTIIPVNSLGQVNPKDISQALKPNTALVTIMHSNNEVGTIQPIREISNILQSYSKKSIAKVLLHSDAAQSLGKLEIDVEDLKIDMLTIVGHKFGASKGVGALYIEPKLRYQS